MAIVRVQCRITVVFLLSVYFHSCFAMIAVLRKERAQVAHILLRVTTKMAKSRRPKVTMPKYK